jgi:hypothetical protein
VGWGRSIGIGSSNMRKKLMLIYRLIGRLALPRKERACQIISRVGVERRVTHTISPSEPNGQNIKVKVKISIIT